MQQLVEVLIASALASPKADALQDVSRIAQQISPHCLELMVAPWSLPSVWHQLRCKDAEDDTSIELTPQGTAVVSSGHHRHQFTEPLGLIRSIRIQTSSEAGDDAPAADYSLEAKETESDLIASSISLPRRRTQQLANIGAPRTAAC